MANRYWVGRSVNGDWSSASNWSASSNGSGGASVPTAADDVFFDQYSFNAPGQGVVLSNTTSSCRSMDWTGATNTPRFTFAALSVFGSLTFIQDMRFSTNDTSYSGCYIVFSATSGTHTINMPSSFRWTNANPDPFFRGWVQFYCSGSATYNLVADMYCYDLDLINGTFNSNNYNLVVSTYLSFLDASYGYNIPLPHSTTVNLGTSSVSGSRVTIAGSDKITLNASQATLSTAGTFYAGTGHSIGKLTFPDIGVSCEVGGTFSLGTFEIPPTTVRVKFNSGSVITVNTLIATGTVSHQIILQSYTAGQAWTLSSPSGTKNCNYLTLSDSHAIGGAIWNAGANSIDGGGNTGWVFNTVVPCVYTAAQTAPSHPAEAGTYVVAVVSANSGTCTGGSWTASLPGGSPAWISGLTPTSGTGPATTYISVTLQANASYVDSRSATIVVNGINITVTQRAASLPTCEYSVVGPVNMAYTEGDVVLLHVDLTPPSCAGGSWSIPLQYLEASSSWLSVTPTSGNTSTPFITFTTTSTNYDVSTRATTLRLVNASGAYTDFAVIQASSYLHCDNYTTSDVGPFYFPTPAATSSITVVGSPSGCNYGLYDVESDSAWLTITSFMPDPPGDYFIIPGVGPFSFQTGTISVALEENTGAAAREGHITITSETAEVLYVITYTQAGTDTPDTCTSFSTLQSGPYDLSWQGSVYDTEVVIPVVGSPVGCINGTWSVVSNDAWLSVSAPLNGSFRVSWLSNPAMVARTGTVTINGNPDQTITFNQEPAAVLPEYCSTLLCPQAGTYSVSHPAGNLNFTLVGNTSTCQFQNLSVTVSDGSWMTLASTSEKEYSISWSQNTTEAVRTGTVTVSYLPYGGTLATGVVLTIVQYPLVTALYPPFPPFNVLAVLNANNTATITWENGGQLGLTGVQFQTVINGIIGTVEELPVVSRYTTGVLSPNTTYNFRIALVNDVGVSPVVTSNNVFFTIAVPPEAIKPPRIVAAFFDDPSQTILLEWDLNGQTDLDGYAIIGVDPTSPAVVYNTVLATHLTITDLSLFVSGNSYTFQVALTRSSGANRLTSPFTTSNAVTILKPTSPRNLYGVKFFYSPV